MVVVRMRDVQVSRAQASASRWIPELSGNGTHDAKNAGWNQGSQRIAPSAVSIWTPRVSEKRQAHRTVRDPSALGYHRVWQLSHGKCYLTPPESVPGGRLTERVRRVRARDFRVHERGEQCPVIGIVKAATALCAGGPRDDYPVERSDFADDEGQGSMPDA